MMICKGYAHIICDLAETVYAVAKASPFIIVHYVFVFENRLIGALYRVALLRNADNPCAHLLEKRNVVCKVFFYFIIRFRKKK